MKTKNLGTSVKEIEQIVAHQVANAIDAIAIYESINQTKQRENKVAGNASNKRNQCAEKCSNYKWRGHQARDCRIPVLRVKQRFIVSRKKAKVFCYGCEEGLVSNFMESQDARLSKFEADFKWKQSKMTNKIDIVLKAITERIMGALPSDTIGPQLSGTTFVYTKRDDGDVMSIEIVKKNDASLKEEPEAGGLKGNSNKGISDFIGRIKGMHDFVGNFTYAIDFMIVEDISSIIDPMLSRVVLGKPFIKLSNMTHDPPERVMGFTKGTAEISYKMPHKIEQYNSLSDLEKEHTKSVYLRNEEDKRRGVEYVMRKILWFYKECLELGPEYVTGMDDEGEVT
uniref:Retrotransposon Orf1 n=1 Tax=Tanacetum cinerariifolium TaxID=118510 RepID=A0A6L2K9N4_TANCI|nr:retrotransposon Orf1 [Tanacetum cinerariifolium]